MYPIGSKLGVNMLFYTHVGVYCGNGKVLHNHWKNGTEIVSLQEFCGDRKIMVLSSGVKDVTAFFNRVNNVLANARPYDVFKNNCDHTASFVREGVASSPQLSFYGGIGLLIGVYALVRGARA
ncbi:MAG: hypothetical protein AB2809_12075 [Candidatus Thiodiazotropha sp.]